MNKWLIAGLASLAMCGGVQAQTGGIVTLVPLDAAAVTIGGTAVVALTGPHRIKGGWLYNPPIATANLCIAEIGTPTVISGGNTSCIVPGQTYMIVPGSTAVSVVASDSSHAFSGYGWLSP